MDTYKEPKIAEIELMKSVLATAIKDYMNGINISKGNSWYRALKKNDQAILGRARSAKNWIEGRGKDSRGYVCGFIYICKIIGLDPDRLRRRILAIKTSEDVAELKEKYIKVGNHYITIAEEEG